MSLVNIRIALETAVNAISPALSTSWENVPFEPVPGTPYQEVFIDPGVPDNVEWGAGYQHNGILQINLRYPLQTGSSAAALRAELIKNTFKLGSTYGYGGTQVQIYATADIGRGVVVQDRWFVPVRVFFSANILM